MLQKCSMLFTAVLLSLVLATSAQAVGKTYSLLAGSGAQTHIGNGLALPIQPAATVTGMGQPPLLIPLKGGVPRPIYQTTAMTSQQKMTVPNGVLKRTSVQNTVGVYTSNTALYAVGTALTFEWPYSNSGTRMFSTGVRSTATQTITHVVGNASARYSPGTLVKAFGGAAQFRTAYPGGQGLFPGAPVSLYLVAGGLAPACGPVGTPGCRALMVGAYPNGHGAIGASPGVVIATAGVPALAASVPLSVGLAPPGTILAVGVIGPGPALTNMATSNGFPWTAGKLTLSASTAAPPELFVLSGTDTRNATGVGMISMVAGSLSQRTLSGPNANRAWVKLIIGNGDPLVPALSTWGRATAAGFIALVALGYVKRSRWGAKTA